MSSDTQVATTGAGSVGNETTYFGQATKAAVMKFQSKYGISPVAGFVGSITRAKLNSMCSGGNTTTGGTTTGGTTTTGGALTVSSASQPSNGLAPESASRVPFTTLTLTAGSADVTVNSITVERTGLAQDAVFGGVVLLNSDGTQIGIAKTLNSDHRAMVGEPFVVKAGTSKTVTVAGNMAVGSTALDAYAGQVAGLNVVAVNTSATVGGSLPITGAMHTINATLGLGSVTMNISSFDPNTLQTKEIGTTGYKFAGIRVTAGSVEKIKIHSIRWNQSGSASSN
jgi:peptidoglycan hydrolase-like protein with peptidoglycan-binding domain